MHTQESRWAASIDSSCHQQLRSGKKTAARWPIRLAYSLFSCRCFCGISTQKRSASDSRSTHTYLISPLRSFWAIWKPLAISTRLEINGVILVSTLTARISSETLPIAKIRENLTYHQSADYVFWQIAKAAGNPPILLMDIRPVSYALCVVLSHDVAEQISRSSKQFPYSTPKSPTFQELVPIVGSHSIILSQVAIISLTGYISISLCDFINFF